MEMKLKQVLNERQLKALVNTLQEVEYESTLDGDWAELQDTFIAKRFLEMSESEQRVYALMHAEHYTRDMVDNWTYSEYKRMYGSDYDELLSKFK
mgnify:FL=1